VILSRVEAQKTALQQYRIIAFTALLGVSACAAVPTQLPTPADASSLASGEAIAASEVDAMPVVEIASTERYGAGAICEERPPSGSRIRRLRCYDQRASKLTYAEFASMPDGLQPAAVLLPRR
jgi:hypothetical protein